MSELTKMEKKSADHRSETDRLYKYMEELQYRVNQKELEAEAINWKIQSCKDELSKLEKESQ